MIEFTHLWLSWKWKMLSRYEEKKERCVRSRATLRAVITWSATWAFLFQCIDNSLILIYCFSKSPKPFLFYFFPPKAQTLECSDDSDACWEIEFLPLILSLLFCRNKLMNVKWFQLKSLLCWCWERRMEAVWHCTELAHKDILDVHCRWKKNDCGYLFLLSINATVHLVSREAVGFAVADTDRESS